MAEDFDVVMLDISLPDASVVETVATLRRRRPELPILIVSMHAEEQYALRSFAAGAHGYVTKDCAAGELIGAVRKVAAGERGLVPSRGTSILRLVVHRINAILS